MIRHAAITIVAILLTILTQVYFTSNGMPLDHFSEVVIVFVFAWIVSWLVFHVVKWALDKCCEMGFPN
jgi:hypothetical protein